MCEGRGAPPGTVDRVRKSGGNPGECEPSDRTARGRRREWADDGGNRGTFLCEIRRKKRQRRGGGVGRSQVDGGDRPVLGGARRRRVQGGADASVVGGGIFGVGAIRHGFRDKKFLRVIENTIILLFISIVILILAAVIEVYITPIFF